jgi:glyoxylase-like metal-dependent hydrolase (beta-lactamase superfamily II)
MNIISHYCPQGFGNCYLLGTQNERTNKHSPKEAILVDPGDIDSTILNCIEHNHYHLKGILITHNHLNHVRGLRTIMRIYQTEIYAAQQNIFEYKTNTVHDGDIVNIGSFTVEVISVPGHSADSVIYKIKHFLFTGDALSAGMMGSTPSPYSAMRQITIIQNKIFSLQGNFVVFPGHGPPTSLKSERNNNIDTGRFLENRKKTRRWTGLELLD